MEKSAKSVSNPEGIAGGAGLGGAGLGGGCLHFFGGNAGLGLSDLAVVVGIVAADVA